MVNMFLIYFMLMGLFKIAYFHGKVVKPGNERSVIRKVFLIYIQAVFWAALVTIGPAFGIPGGGYLEWWTTYSSQHSMLLWILFVIPVTAFLYFVKVSTYSTMLRPGHYGMFSGPAPDLCTLNMRMPLVWYLVYWGWLLLNPMLPFFNCFVRIFLLRSPVYSVFPYA